MYLSAIEGSALSRQRLAEQATEILAGAIAIAHAIQEARRRQCRRPGEASDMSRSFEEEIEHV